MATDPRHFFNAAQVGNTDVVINLVRSGRISDLNCRDCDGRTAMMVAALNNHKNIVKFLIHYGADTEAHDNRSTALCLAAWHGHLAIVKLLVDADAVIDRAVVDGLTPLLVASVVGHVDVVSFLMERGAAFNHQCSTLETALHLAVTANRVDVIKTLIHRGASVLVRDNNLSTPLMVACKRRNIPALTAILETLRAKGEHGAIADVLKAPTFDDETPLIWAAHEGSLAVVRVLLDYSAAREGKNDSDTTALNAAVKNEQLEIVQCLVEHGANIDHAGITGDTPLMVAAHKGFIAIVKLLLKAGAKLDARDQGGFTPLHGAVCGGQYEMTKLLVEHGAALEARTNKGYTPLLHAAEQGHLRIVQYLVKQGASIDVETHHGKTPLFASCAMNQDETSRFLIELVAESDRLGSLNAQDLTGRTPLHWTAGNGDLATARLLVQHGADLNITDEWGLTPLHMAFLNCQEGTTQLLVDSGGVPINEDDIIWPIAAIEELHGRPLVLGSEQRTVKHRKWFIAPSSIRFVYGNPTHLRYVVVCVGTWLGAPVTILRPLLPLSRSAREAQHSLQYFRRGFSLEVMRWYPLNHPHLLKLYGACHLPDQMLLVTERVAGDTLREYLHDHPHKKWTVLYQVALAVQYLHERGLVHQRLRGENIHVTEECIVKLAGFGILSSYQTNDDTEDMRWRSPELLSSGQPEREDDIYSLGMCIIEAVTGEQPYSDCDPEFHKHDLKKWITHGMPPDRSSNFSDREWDLVTRMITFARFHRPSITDVVRELEELAGEEDRDSQAATEVKDADAQLAEVSSLVNKANGEDSGLMKLNHQAFERLNNLWLLIHLSAADAPVRAEERFRIILTRLVNQLTKYQMDIDAGARQFSERQQGDAIFSLHNDIDRLAHELGVKDVMSKQIHEWRQNWHDHRVARLNRVEESLTETELAKLEASADHVQVLTCLYFELTRHRLSYASVLPQIFHAVCRRIKQLPDIHVADWFLPHYEINFDQKIEFNRGSFGSVHFGKWMNSRVIVKKVFAQDLAAFEREVEIWFQLYHPHVVQLFGACHLAGKQFFVCEVAKNGQLDVYLRRDDICRCRVVWQHLYEAAVALQYLHYKGILHRDLKCNNILVGSDGKTKLADFGLSSVVDNERDSKTHAKGATRWKAPEILRGEAASPASDVYGLAMCIAEAVTGKYPWRRSDDKHNDSYRRDKSVADSDVKEFVKDGHIMQRPTSFRDAQWELVEQMTRFDASKRLPLEKVVETMRRFAQEEAAGEYDKKEPEPEQVMSPMAESESKSLVMSSFSSCRADSDSGGLFD